MRAHVHLAVAALPGIVAGVLAAVDLARPSVRVVCVLFHPIF